MKNLEHGIVVGRFFRDILDDVPVFDDFPVFDAEDVDSCLTAVFFVELDVVVDEDKVAIGADVLNDEFVSLWLTLALNHFGYGR